MKAEPTETILSVRAISKSFPGVHALSGVDFELRAGEVHALVGENGAGKSTLARIIAGVGSADAGRMEFLGREYKPSGRTDAEAYGVRIVMQELNLISTLTVAENIFIERLPSRLGFVNYRKLNSTARAVMEKVGLGDIDPSTPVGTLGVGRQQMVEIAAGLSALGACRVLALDEPTASLTDSEIELLFAQIERLKAAGVGIIYISHRIEEVMRIADRLTILRDGAVILTDSTDRLSIDQIIRQMVGRDLGREHFRDAGKAAGETALRVVGLNRGDKVRDVCFEVHRGEILGVAGLMGSGRTETMRAIFGADRADSGDIFLAGSNRPAKIRSPRDAVRSGIALLTEDRKEQGLLAGLTVRANITLARLKDLARLGWISNSKERTVAEHYVKALAVRCRSGEQSVGELSGGNQQKVVIAKWLYRDCDILIFDEPTRGIDVGAKFEIYRMLGKLADEGKAIVFVSSDLKELMAVCSRIMVMSAGRVAATFGRGQWTQEKIMAAALSEYLNA
jgi:ribose transport system ATP-binding protein